MSRPALLGNIGLAVVAMLGMLLVLEVVCRLVAPQYHNFVQPDDVLGFSYVRNARYTFWPPERCPGWGSSGSINSHGLRDREYDYVKSPGVRRVLALGDSYTEGLQFDLDKTWVKRLERKLNERSDGVKYEVINAGRSGMGTGLEYLYFVTEGWKYHPDVVLLLFIPNDFADNSRALNGALQPYFGMSERGLTLDTSFSATWSYRLRTIVNQFARMSYLVEFVRATYAQNERRTHVQTAGADERDLSGPRQAAIQITQELLRALANASRQHGARFAMAIGSADDDTNWMDSLPGKERTDGFASNAPKVIAEFCLGERIPHLDLSPILKAYSVARRAFIHGCAENGGRGHWSEAGHEVAADAIYQFLVDQSLIP